LIWELKLYSDINPNWDNYYAYKMSITSNGNIVAAGRYQLNQNIIIRIDTSGNLISRKHINLGYDVLLQDFIYTDSAYYFLGAVTNHISGDYVFNISKTDTGGNILFNKNFGAYHNSIETGSSFLIDNNENYHVAGVANYMTGNNYFLNVYNPIGDTLTTYLYPVAAPWDQLVLYNLKIVGNKYYLSGFLGGYSAGLSIDDAVILCIDTNGTELFRSVLGLADYDDLYDLIFTNDSNIVCVGQSAFYNLNSKVYLIKVNPTILLNAETVLNEEEYSISRSDEKIFVDFKDLNISAKKISLIDLSGKLVKTVSSNLSRAELEIGLINSGIYILRIESDEMIFSKKIVIGSIFRN
jgi:hypothetical protein